jgi:hypothetical protein
MWKNLHQNQIMDQAVLEGIALRLRREASTVSAQPNRAQSNACRRDGACIPLILVNYSLVRRSLLLAGDAEAHRR